MADCSKCLKSLKNVKVKVNCADCDRCFHARCVDMSAEEVSYLSEQDSVWRCDPCSKSRRQSMALESKSGVTYDDIFNLVMELKSEFKSVEKSLGASMNSCHEEIAATKTTVDEQRKELAAWMKVVEELKAENALLRNKVVSLELRLEESEQYSRRNTLEIHGVPMERGEDVVALVKSVGRALDYPIEDNMIDACHRLRSRDGSGKAPGIVVKLVRRMDAEGLLHKRRVKRNLNTHDLGLTSRPAEVVYVNESLAPGRRKLLSAARQLKKDKGYTFLWIRGGQILMRKNSGDRVIVLRSVDDLARL